jgi:hypothetical protein
LPVVVVHVAGHEELPALPFEEEAAAALARVPPPAAFRLACALLRFSPFGTMLKRSIATLPPGHVIVPWRASLKASVMGPDWSASPARDSAAERLALAYPSRLPVKSEPSSDVLPEATSQVARPLDVVKIRSVEEWLPATSIE